MTRISNVLVPIDFSETSKKAMFYAAHLASMFTAKLTAAHIIPDFNAFNYSYPFAGDPAEFEAKALAETKRLLPEEIPANYRDQLHTQTIAKCGDIREELLGIVTDEKVDLVVMGTHGRRSLARHLLGSVTEGLLRRVPVPILTISHRGTQQHADSPFTVPFRRILYATDLSEEGLSGGLHYCTDLARTLGARLTLLHVMHLPETPAFDDEATLQAQRMGDLHKAVQREHGEDLHVTTEVLRGTPHREILKYAESAETDLIVINLQSKGLLERTLLGSTAERVIRSAHIPVLSIPSGAAEGRTAVNLPERAVS
jgi:nucleotide-binding universal stress UspA family protein